MATLDVFAKAIPKVHVGDFGILDRVGDSVLYVNLSSPQSGYLISSDLNARVVKLSLDELPDLPAGWTRFCKRENSPITFVLGMKKLWTIDTESSSWACWGEHNLPMCSTLGVSIVQPDEDSLFVFGFQDDLRDLHQKSPEELGLQPDEESLLSNFLFHFDIPQRKWTQIHTFTPEVYPMSYHTSTAVKDDVFVVGSSQNPDQSIFRFRWTGDAEKAFEWEVIEIANDSPKLPMGLVHHSTCVHCNKLLISGGVSDVFISKKLNRSNNLDLFAFDLQEKTIEVVGTIKEPRSCHGSVSIEDKLVLIGGRKGLHTAKGHPIRLKNLVVLSASQPLRIHPSSSSSTTPSQSHNSSDTIRVKALKPKKVLIEFDPPALLTGTSIDRFVLLLSEDGKETYVPRSSQGASGAQKTFEFYLTRLFPNAIYHCMITALDAENRQLYTSKPLKIITPPSKPKLAINYKNKMQVGVLPVGMSSASPSSASPVVAPLFGANTTPSTSQVSPSAFSFSTIPTHPSPSRMPFF